MRSSKTLYPVKCLFVILFAASVFAGCSTSQTSDNSAPIDRDMVKAPVDRDALVTPANIENTADQISQANFDKIKNGMSQFDVEVLIAGKSRKVTSKKQDGVLRETYRWETVDGARYIEVAFENEKVVGKNQKGLQ